MKRSMLLCALSGVQVLFGAADAEQAVRCYTKPETGFVRGEDDEIKVIAYCSQQKDIIARLIDAGVERSESSTALAELSALPAAAVLLKDFPKEPGYGETTILNAIYNDSIRRTMRRADLEGRDRCDVSQLLCLQRPASLSKRYGTVVQVEEDPNGQQHWLEHHPAHPLYKVLNRDAFMEAKRVVLPFAETDSAAIDDCGFWLVASEGGKFVNLYPLRDYCVRDSVAVDGSDQLIASIHDSVDKTPAIRLHTKGDDDKDAFIFSFALTKGTSGIGKKIATVSPRAVTLWCPAGHSDDPKAYGKVIAKAHLDADKPLGELSCFNSAVFSAKGEYLYVSGSNSVSRYTCKEEKFESFQYTTVPGLSGTRPIALSPDERILAVADPHVGVTVFATATMQQLCRFLQGSYCKLLSCGPDKVIATSVPSEEGTSQDSLWGIELKREPIAAEQSPDSWCAVQ